jgi:uncharacterized 2Fe-2S/4Fe-4S cluster protein (DUF4445 family)
MDEIKIKILPEDREISSKKNKNLLEALIENGINIYADCGGQGVCGKCKVKVISGEFNTEESYLISSEEKKNNIVLACETFPKTDIIIELIKELQVGYIQTIKENVSLCLQSEQENLEFLLKKQNLDLNPIIKFINLKLQKPTLEKPISDFENLLSCLSDELKESRIFLNNFEILQNLSIQIRDYNWECGVLVGEDITENFDTKSTRQNNYEILQVLPYKENKEFYGIALDIGTTTVSASLINLNDFVTIITKSAFNQQIVYGEDVITRIIYSEKEDGLRNLNQKIINTINQIIDSICFEKGILFKDIHTAVVAGNTTMIHILFNIAPKYIRIEPYIPTITFPPSLNAKQVGFNINPYGKIYSLPLVSSYIGGDIVSGIIATGIDLTSDISVLLDLGTNGEIVLGNSDFLVSAACSCGPAFEGVGITSGMRATIGAIEDIEFKDGEINYKVIGNTKPVGICGSGLIDIPAELFKARIIDRSGKFIRDNKLYSKYIRENENGEFEFVIVKKEFTANNKDIVITESDIQNILRSKGAIFHGLHTLVKYLNLNFEDIKKVYIAGGFGCFLDINKAKILGLLPDIDEKKFVIAGNTSLTGAKMFLVSKKARKRAYEVARKMTYVDLSSLPMYMNEYTSSLFIPHTDFSLFPNVSKML